MELITNNKKWEVRIQTKKLQCSGGWNTEHSNTEPIQNPKSFDGQIWVLEWSGP